jgi:hypothetical protein
LLSGLTGAKELVVALVEVAAFGPERARLTGDLLRALAHPILADGGGAAALQRPVAALPELAGVEAHAARSAIDVGAAPLALALRSKRARGADVPERSRVRGDRRRWLGRIARRERAEGDPSKKSNNRRASEVRHSRESSTARAERGSARKADGMGIISSAYHPVATRLPPDRRLVTV